MSKEKRKARWLFFGKDKYTYDTIDELVNKSMGLAVGEVVTLNGYYSADDGATHKRVIADTDDGSGVQLRSGKWANIVHNGEVNVSWFGCKKDVLENNNSIISKLFTIKNIKKIIFDINCEVGEVLVNLDNSSIKEITSLNKNIITGKFKFSSTLSTVVAVYFHDIILDGNKRYTHGLDYTSCKYLYGEIFSRIEINNYTVAGFESCSTIFAKMEDFNISRTGDYGIKINYSNIWSTTTYIGRCYITNCNISGIHVSYCANLELDQCILEYCDLSKSQEHYGSISLISCIRTKMNCCHLEENNRGKYLKDSRFMVINEFNKAKENDIITYENLEFANRTYSNFDGGEINAFKISNFDNRTLSIGDIEINNNKAKFGNMKQYSFGGYKKEPYAEFEKIAEVDYSDYMIVALRLGATDTQVINDVFELKKGITDFTSTSFKYELNNETKKIEFYLKMNNFSWIEYARKYDITINHFSNIDTVRNLPKISNIQIQKLDASSYMSTKMKQEGVYNDYISYMDEKTAYDKQQRKLEQEKQLAYEEALKENPELTYEEFMSLQPMMLNLMEEPQPSENLKKFMDKYL